MQIGGFQDRDVGAQAIGKVLSLGRMRLAGAAGEQKSGDEGGKAARTVGHGGFRLGEQGMNLPDMNDPSLPSKWPCDAS